MIFQGIWTSIAKKPYIFVIYLAFGGGGGPDPLYPSWSTHGSKVLILLFIHCLLWLQLSGGGLCWVLDCGAVLGVLSSFAEQEKEMATLL